jgi:hypothetical protein
MNNLTTKISEADKTDKQKFDDLFGFEFATPEESAKKRAELVKRGVHGDDDIMNINGTLYYVDYPGYDPYINPEPKCVLYEIRSK